jgi:capsid protein
MEAIIMASEKSDGTNFTKQFDNLDDIAQDDKRGGAFSRVLARFGSKEAPAGTVLNMGTKESYEFHDIKTPSNTFGAFKDWIVNYIGAATGTPPEVILSKYSTSYTAHRGALNDFQKSYMNKRRVFERIVMYPVIKEIAKEAILSGTIEAPGFFEGSPIIQRAYLQGMTLGPVPGTINPLQEVNANEKAVDAAFLLRSDVAALYGNEWDNMIEEWAEEQEDYINKSPEKRAEIIKSKELNNHAGSTEEGNEE